MLTLTARRNERLSRRNLLKGSAALGGALVIATHISPPAFAAETAARSQPAPMPNAFIRIAPDDTVTVIIKHLDKGQGVATGLTTIVADELGADWPQMRAEFAPANAALYSNLAFGLQGTGGSTSIANSWMQLRSAAAAAREMLVTAAADQWQVPASEITVEKGVVGHPPTGKTARLGTLAPSAAKLPVPQNPTLKDPAAFRLIGSREVKRLDTPNKITGKTIYAMDVKRPNMVYAVLARSPKFGGTVKAFDASAATALPGVVDIVRVPMGVAVLGTTTWAAKQGRDALNIDWDFSKAETRSSDAILADYKKRAAEIGLPAVAVGDTTKALASADKVVEGEFEFPYLAHAPMEPLNCVVELTADGCEIWAGSQFQTVEQGAVAAVLGIKPEQVKINTLFAGGSFGRRATPGADYFVEAATIAKAWGGQRPVHLVWTREDDIRGGYYRPMVYHKVRAGLDKDGRIIAWDHHIVAQQIMEGTPFEKFTVRNGIDSLSIEGVPDMPYAVPNVSIAMHPVRAPVPVLWWRSVGHTHTAQVVEVMIDDLAHAAGKDPVEFRLALLKDHPRHAGVLKLAAEKAGWGQALPKGRGIGIAVHESFKTFVAQAAEVTVADNGTFKVDKVVCAVDCGIAVNPDIVVAQMEGGVGYGLGAALRNKITLTNGEVDQSNFHDYEPLRIVDMPTVEVHIAASGEAPTGVGEPGVPAVAPAISNAIFAACGKRLRSLPFSAASQQGA
ncbi:MAG TPA: xanthine dehydrogenase family protein molybdopterin-binding subunit [Rhodopila sp.]